MVTPVKKVPIHLQSAQNRLLIKNGTVVNDDGQESIDVYIEDSRIKQMGSHLIIPGGTRVIDATGKFILPGGIDANVHLEAPYLANTEVCDSINFFCLYKPDLKLLITIVHRIPRGLSMTFIKELKLLWRVEPLRSLIASCPLKTKLCLRPTTSGEAGLTKRYAVTML